jgi:hypothetical protein
MPIMPSWAHASFSLATNYWLPDEKVAKYTVSKILAKQSKKMMETW